MMESYAATYGITLFRAIKAIFWEDPIFSGDVIGPNRD
jgi:hypothetical protein